MAKDDPENPREGRHDAYAAFRVPAYRQYILGSLLMQVGTSGQTLAIGWEMYNRTDDYLSLGLVGLVQAIPMLLLTLPAGYLADVFDRRKLMVLSMLGTSLTSIGLAIFSWMEGSIPWMYALLFLDSAFLRIGWPARAALMPLLVPRDTFENAVKWRTSLGQISGMVGPAIGGFIIAWSLPAAYVFSAASTLVFMAILMWIRIDAKPEGKPGRMFAQLAEGLRFVWGQKLLLGAISLDLFAVLLGGAVYLLPVYARDIINLEGTGLDPEQALGWLRAAPAAGALVMALTLVYLPPMKRAGATMLLSVAGFGVATIIFGLSTSLWLSMAMLFLTGVFDNVSVVVRHTLVQLATPNHVRGRVSAVNAVFISSSNELGGFESGLVAKLFSPVISVVSGGIGTVLVVIACAKLFPGLRRVGRLDLMDPQQAPPPQADRVADRPAAETA